MTLKLDSHYPACRAELGRRDFERLLAALDPGAGWERFPDIDPL